MDARVRSFLRVNLQRQIESLEGWLNNTEADRVRARQLLSDTKEKEDQLHAFKRELEAMAQQDEHLVSIRCKSCGILHPSKEYICAAQVPRQSSAPVAGVDDCFEESERRATSEEQDEVPQPRNSKVGRRFA